MTTLIPRNTTIPTRKSEIFSTAADNQTSVEVHVLQGERPLARDNRTLGRFHLIGLPPAPRGVPQIEVTFDIDANGIVNVSAKDLGTGKEQKITITASSGLGKDEVERMMREAESHADEDKKRRDEIETRNQADQAVYGAERMIKDTGDKLSAADRQAIESAMEAVKKASEGTDAAAIQTRARSADGGAAQGGRGALQAAGGRRVPGGPADPRRRRTGRPPAGPARRRATSSTRKWSTKEAINESRIRRSGGRRKAVKSSTPQILRSSNLHGSLHRPRPRARRDAGRHQARLQAARAEVPSGHQPGRPDGGGAVPSDRRGVRDAERSRAARRARRDRGGTAPRRGGDRSASKGSISRSAFAAPRRRPSAICSPTCCISARRVTTMARLSAAPISTRRSRSPSRRRCAAASDDHRHAAGALPRVPGPRPAARGRGSVSALSWGGHR